MRNLFIFLLMAICLTSRGSAFYYNSFTTNTDYNALALATNIANSAIQGSVQASLSPTVIANAGGLTTNNYASYADTNGAAFYWYSAATNYAATNIPANVVTIPILTAATNSLWSSTTNYVNSATNGLVTAAVTNGLASIGYANSTTNGLVTSSVTNGLATLQAATNAANSVYSNNPSLYLTPSATNNITALGNNVVVGIQSGGGIIVATYPSASGITVSLTATGTNNVSVTNFNATTLAGYGALTTNSSSWTNYVAPINDWTNATIYTNGLLSSANAAATYQPVGNYLTPASSLNYNNITNPPIIPSTNGFVTASITNGLATTAYVNAATNGFVTAAVTNGLATISYVNSATNGFVTSNITNGLATTNFVTSQGYTNANILSAYSTTNYVNTALSFAVSSSQLNSASNSLQSQITFNSNSINATWSTNQAFVGNILVSSNMTVSLSTNAGVITATLGSFGGAVSGFQPASQNLTNWSTIGTNQILITTNVITSVVASTTASVSLATNSSGISATIGSTYTGQSPAAWQSVTFTTPSTAGAVFNGTWSNPLLASPTSLKVYYSGSSYSVSTLTATTAGFSFADSGGAIGTNKTVTVIGFCY